MLINIYENIVKNEQNISISVTLTFHGYELQDTDKLYTIMHIRPPIANICETRAVLMLCIATLGS